MTDTQQITSEEINAYFNSIDGVETELRMIGTTGKVVPYVGWYWRNVDFDKPFVLYKPKVGGFDVPGWYGFMQNNKWGYSEVEPSAEDCLLIRAAAARLALEKSNEAAIALYDIIQEVGKRSPVAFED